MPALQVKPSSLVTLALARATIAAPAASKASSAPHPAGSRSHHSRELVVIARSTCPAWPALKALRPFCSSSDASALPSAMPATCVPAAAAVPISASKPSFLSAFLAESVRSTYISSTLAFSIAADLPQTSAMICRTFAPEFRYKPMSLLPCAVGTWMMVRSEHVAHASLPRIFLDTPFARASYETAIIPPLAEDGMSTSPFRTTTLAEAGSAGKDFTPLSPALPSPWYGLYCTTASGCPFKSGCNARSHAQ
mmetsp:Transcript_21066/g.38457  ORF Transcript_21066/g.38457 Transcript_21066/m.38457 type:complete len:251 (-) Transcript_21066:129-881(-)